MKGTTVTLYERTQIGTDDFGAPVFSETPVSVKNVLIGQPDSEDIATATDLYGKKLSCVLGVPKGDIHVWQDCRVDWRDAYGREHHLRVVGFPVTGIEANVPGPWHKKVRCEEIE